jgi:hypothetical protein
MRYSTAWQAATLEGTAAVTHHTTLCLVPHFPFYARDVAFAPAQHGIVLAAASDDGGVYVHEGTQAADAQYSGGELTSGGCSGGGGLIWTMLSRIKVRGMHVSQVN